MFYQRLFAFATARDITRPNRLYLPQASLPNHRHKPHGNKGKQAGCQKGQSVIPNQMMQVACTVRGYRRTDLMGEADPTEHHTDILLAEQISGEGGGGGDGR